MTLFLHHYIITLNNSLQYVGISMIYWFFLHCSQSYVIRLAVQNMTASGKWLLLHFWTRLHYIQGSRIYWTALKFTGTAIHYTSLHPTSICIQWTMYTIHWVSGHIASSQIASMEAMCLEAIWQCTHTCKLPPLKKIYIYFNRHFSFSSISLKH